MINEATLVQLKTNFPNWKEILVLTSQNANIDRLAAALAIYLALEKVGKKVQIATEANLTVSQSQLFGIGEIKNRFPQMKGGDMTLTLENVVIDAGPDAGKVPALEKLDWFPEGKDLKLVFHVMTGQRFEPSNVGVAYAHGKFDAIIVIGAAGLDNLGRIYSANKSTFGETEVINIDNQPQNSQFGAINIVDPTAGTVSEMVVGALNQLGVGMDGDIASNILAGVYNATHNLTQKVTAETFLAIGQAMQAGGKYAQSNRPPQSNVGFQSSGSGQFKANNSNNNRPQALGSSAQPEVRQNPVQPDQKPLETKKENPFLTPPAAGVGFNPVFTPQFQASMEASEEVAPQATDERLEQVDSRQDSKGGFDLKQFNESQLVSADSTSASSAALTTSPLSASHQTNTVNNSQPQQQAPVTEADSVVVSDEEEMNGEGEFSPAPDWLTPKVYKSGGLG